MYIYVEGHVAELKPPHTQSVSSLREKMFKMRELGKKVQVAGLAAYCNFFLKKKKEDIEIYIYIYIYILFFLS